MENNQQNLAAAGRVLIAALFLVSVLFKLMDYQGTVGWIGSVGLPVPPLAYVVAVIVELIGGVALIVGFKTRWVAIALAAYSVAAALAFHNNFADPNQLFNFLKNFAIVGGLLQVIAFGAGSLSLDAKRK